MACRGFVLVEGCLNYGEIWEESFSLVVGDGELEVWSEE